MVLFLISFRFLFHFRFQINITKNQLENDYWNYSYKSQNQESQKIKQSQFDEELFEIFKKKSLDLQYQKLIKLLEMRIWLERKVQKSNLKNAKIIQINAKGRLV